MKRKRCGMTLIEALAALAVAALTIAALSSLMTAVLAQRRATYMLNDAVVLLGDLEAAQGMHTLDESFVQTHDEHWHIGLINETFDTDDETTDWLTVHIRPRDYGGFQWKVAQVRQLGSKTEKN